MKILVVRPGPRYSVEDVANGWVKGLTENGHEVIDWDLGTRIAFFVEAYKAVKKTEEVDLLTVIMNSTSLLEAACWEYNPDVVLLITGVMVPEVFYKIAKKRHFVALVATESPYEDGVQLELAKHCHMTVINDTRNIDKFQELSPTFYYGHGYDPDVHYSGPPNPDYESDFCFIGSFYKERIETLEKINLDLFKTVLGGDHRKISDSSPLKKYFVNRDERTALQNVETAEYYRSAKIGANLYRKENNYSHEGDSCGPREIEMAASGLFFIRETRPESDSLFPMLPTFESPKDLEQKILYWLKNDLERQELAELAQQQVTNRTFRNITKRFETDLINLL